MSLNFIWVSRLKFSESFPSLTLARIISPSLPLSLSHTENSRENSFTRDDERESFTSSAKRRQCFFSFGYTFSFCYEKRKVSLRLGTFSVKHIRSRFLKLNGYGSRQKKLWSREKRSQENLIWKSFESEKAPNHFSRFQFDNNSEFRHNGDFFFTSALLSIDRKFFLHWTRKSRMNVTNWWYYSELKGNDWTRR